EILVSEADSPLAPVAAHPETLGLTTVRRQYLGVLGDEHVYAAEVPADAQAPPGWAFRGLRTLFGNGADSLVALAGRALQLIEWDRTHQFCGACGAPTVARLTERSRECPPCGLVVYPRLAPVVMCLVRRG